LFLQETVAAADDSRNVVIDWLSTWSYARGKASTSCVAGMDRYILTLQCAQVGPW